MKKRDYYILAYLLILISFPFIHISFFPKPNLRNLKLNSELKDYFVRKNTFDLHMENVSRRKIIIGDTYFVTDSLNRTFQITPISSWNLKNLNFKKISNDLPTLIIQNSDIRELENNNYGVGKINNDYYSQACLVNENTYFFTDFKSNIPQYWEIKYWMNILKNSLKHNLNFYNSKNENCFLITSNDIDYFQKDINRFQDLIDF